MCGAVRICKSVECVTVWAYEERSVLYVSVILKCGRTGVLTLAQIHTVQTVAVALQLPPEHERSVLADTCFLGSPCTPK